MNAVDENQLFYPSTSVTGTVADASFTVWVNGQQAISLYNDRQSVIDDGVSRRLTLKKGPNVVRAAIINAGGATDFCARFLDADDQPVTRISVNLSRR